MRILSYRDCLLPLVELAADGRVWTLQRLTKALAERIELTEAERRHWTPSSLEAYVGVCVARAKTQLIQAGLLETPGLGRVRISELGRHVLTQGPTQITDRDIKTLKARRRRFNPRLVPILIALFVVSLGMGWLGVIVQSRNVQYSFSRGVEMCRQGNDYKGAAAYLSTAIRLDPNRAAAYYWRGVAHLNEGDDDGAIADYTEAIRRDPKWETYARRGIAYLRNGQYDQAIADFTEVIRVNPERAEAYYWRGVAHLSKGDDDEAIADYTEAIRRDPKWETYARRGVAYSRKGKHDEAVADFTEVIRLNPQRAEAYSARAAAYRALGHPEKAEADERKAKELRTTGGTP